MLLAITKTKTFTVACNTVVELGHHKLGNLRGRKLPCPSKASHYTNSTYYQGSHQDCDNVVIFIDIFKYKSQNALLHAFSLHQSFPQMQVVE